MPVSRLQARRVQSRRRVAPMCRARSKDRPWAYLRHEFHGGALRGSAGGPPGLTENRRKGEKGLRHLVQWEKNKNKARSPRVVPWYSRTRTTTPIFLYFGLPNA